MSMPLPGGGASVGAGGGAEDELGLPAYVGLAAKKKRMRSASRGEDPVGREEEAEEGGGSIGGSGSDDNDGGSIADNDGGGQPDVGRVRKQRIRTHTKIKDAERQA